ncbi:hypothetical protein KUH03_26400 [Sphingobacterium sp. E70]|nr:hypothetical protein [Sphingobacterium sp. E70]ULT22817.1 hypothetical protein KUH03_26400 [Sphingobacterium sp. E70]
MIAGLLKNDSTGIQLIGNLAAEIDLMIRKIENTEGLERIQLLLNCMEQIGSSEEHKVITMAFDTIAGREGNIVIEAIIDYSFKNFLNPISLEEVASSTNMSVSAFCRFFKKNIKRVILILSKNSGSVMPANYYAIQIGLFWTSAIIAAITAGHILANNLRW